MTYHFPVRDCCAPVQQNTAANLRVGRNNCSITVVVCRHWWCITIIISSIEGRDNANRKHYFQLPVSFSWLSVLTRSLDTAWSEASIHLFVYTRQYLDKIWTRKSYLPYGACMYVPACFLPRCLTWMTICLFKAFLLELAVVFIWFIQNTFVVSRAIIKTLLSLSMCARLSHSMKQECDWRNWDGIEDRRGNRCEAEVSAFSWL